MGRTTIAIRTETRARLKKGAEGESMTIDEYLRALLDEHEEYRFWNSFSDVTPRVYAQATASDGDAVDDDFLLEDRGLDAGDE